MSVEPEWWEPYRSGWRPFQRERSAGSLIARALGGVVLAGWAVSLYWGLWMWLLGIGPGSLVFGVTVAVVGLWLIFDFLFLPWIFRRSLIDRYARRHGWEVSKPHSDAGPNKTINLRISGEQAGRGFEVIQVEESGPEDSSLQCFVWRSTEHSLPPGPRRIVRRGRRTRAVNVDHGGVSAVFGHGVHARRLSRWLRFLAEAERQVRAGSAGDPIDQVGQDDRVGGLHPDAG